MGEVINFRKPNRKPEAYEQLSFKIGEVAVEAPVQEELPDFPHGLRLCDPPELGWYKEGTPDDAA